MYEMEGPSRRMCLDVPEAPYSDERFTSIHNTVHALEAVHVASEIYAEEIAVLLGLSIEAAGIAIGAVLGVVGPFLAIGEGYAEAWAKISKQWVSRGYAWGVVTGAGGEKWTDVTSRLRGFLSMTNSADPQAAAVARKAFKVGLAAGYLCGRDLAWNPHKRKFFWDSIRRRFAPNLRAMWHTDVQRFGDRPASWPERDWSDFYSGAMVIFTQQYLKD
jgi:hypothetical protein